MLKSYFNTQWPQSLHLLQKSPVQGPGGILLLLPSVSSNLHPQGLEDKELGPFYLCSAEMKEGQSGPPLACPQIRMWTCCILSPLISLQKVLNFSSRTDTHTACFYMTNTVFQVANVLYSIFIISSTVSPRVILVLFYLSNGIVWQQYHSPSMGFAFSPSKEKRHFSCVRFPKAMGLGFFFAKEMGESGC